MRIRTLKPEWLDDECLSCLSVEARLLSIGLILIADDHGRGRASIAFLASRVFTYEENAKAMVSRSLAELRGDSPRTSASAWAFIRLYSVGGQDYYEITNWSKHQRIDNASRPRVPGPDAEGAIMITSPRNSANLGETRLDLRPPTSDHRPPITDPEQELEGDRGNRSDRVEAGSDRDRGDLRESAEPTRGAPLDDVRTVFEAWRAAFGKNSNATLGERRRRVIRARLRRFAVADLLEAIRGAAADPWRHEGAVRHELATLLKSDEAVEAHLDDAKSAPLTTIPEPEPARESCHGPGDPAPYRVSGETPQSGDYERGDLAPEYAFDDDGEPFAAEPRGPDGELFRVEDGGPR